MPGGECGNVQAGGVGEYNKPLGCGTSVALGMGPTDEEVLIQINVKQQFIPLL